MKFDKIPIDNIKLDPDNPRVNQLQGKIENPNQLDIESALDDSDTKLRELKNSIINFGGIFNAIVLSKEGKDDYKVIEGNTRVFIYRDLREDPDSRDLNEDQWETIPSVIYDCESDEDEKLLEKVRLQAHLLGPRDWKPLNKARYIARLRDSSPEILTWPEIQEIVGSNANLLKNYYDAYKVYEKSFTPVVEENGGDINNEEIMAGKFSSLAEYVKMPHLLVDDYGDDADKQFCEWLYHGKKWTRNAEVRKLKEIFADDEKKGVFLEEDGTVTKAIQINPGTPIEPDLAELCDEVFEKIHVIGPTDWEELKDEDQRTAEAMTHLHSELDKIINN